MRKDAQTQPELDPVSDFRTAGPGGVLLPAWIRQGQARAGFTIEAAFLIPIILFVITGTIQTGYDMFREARICCEIQEELEKFDPVEIVYRNTWIQGFQNKKNELHERKD